MREEGEQSRAGSEGSTKEDQEIRQSSFSPQKEEERSSRWLRECSQKYTRVEGIHCYYRTFDSSE